MLRSLTYCGLVVAIVGALWIYADSLSRDSKPYVVQPNYSLLVLNDALLSADVPLWSHGDVDALTS